MCAVLLWMSEDRLLSPSGDGDRLSLLRTWLRPRQPKPFQLRRRPIRVRPRGSLSRYSGMSKPRHMQRVVDFTDVSLGSVSAHVFARSGQLRDCPIVPQPVGHVGEHSPLCGVGGIPLVLAAHEPHAEVPADRTAIRARTIWPLAASITSPSVMVRASGCGVTVVGGGHPKKRRLRLVRFRIHAPCRASMVGSS
jgi:hypothetical protein